MRSVSASAASSTFSKEKAAPPTEADDTAYLSIFQPGVGAERSKLAHRLKRPSPTVVAVVATIATVAPEAFVITAKETFTVGL